MIAATLIAALAWPSFLKPAPIPGVLKRPIPERLIPHRKEWLVDDPHGEPLARVAFRVEDGLMLAPVTVNGEGPFWFALDSGSTRSVIDPRIVKRSRVATRRPAADAEGPAQRLWATEVKIGEARVFAPQPYALDLRLTHLPRRARGLIGAELFTAYVVRIDPYYGSVSIYDPVTYRPGQAAYVPLTRKDGRFYAPIRVKPAAGGATAAAEVEIDTGSAAFITTDLVRQAGGVKPALVGGGLDEPYWGQAGRMASVEFGGQTLHDVWGVSGPSPSVGMELLRRFTVTFDAAHGRLYLEPMADIYTPVAEPAAPVAGPEAPPPPVKQRRRLRLPFLGKSGA
jgi:hypothetical protein